MRYQYIDTESTNPYWNLALEQYLSDYVLDDEIIFYMWQNDDTIVLGKNQDVFSECRAEEFTADGGRIARRLSGGGTVYHDMGNLNFSLICRSQYADQVSYPSLIINVLKAFHLKADFNGRNDLLIQGRKFSGNACYDDGKICCRHGTILVCTDIGRMSYYLTPEVSKLERNHVQSVKSRVVNLSEVSDMITVESMKKMFIHVVGGKYLDIEIDQSAIREKAGFFAEKKWIYGGVR